MSVLNILSKSFDRSSQRSFFRSEQHVDKKKIRVLSCYYLRGIEGKKIQLIEFTVFIISLRAQNGLMICN